MGKIEETKSLKTEDLSAPSRRIVYGYIAAEVELIIGIVSAALILIYQQNYLLAFGTLTGFLILEFLILLVLSMAEDTLYTRRQIEENTRAAQEKRSPRTVLDEVGSLTDRFYLLRIIGISVLVTSGIVLFRSML